MNMEQRKKRNKPEKKQVLDDLLSKFRESVRPYIAEFKAQKKTVNGWTDEYKNKPIKNRRKVTVDHVYPLSFRRLAYEFIKSRKIDLDLIPWFSPTKITIILNDWVEFHNKNAELRVVSANTNKWLWFKNRKDDIPYTQFYEN